MSNENQAGDPTAQPVERSTALTKFDEKTLKGIVPAGAGVQRAVFLPSTFAEALEMSKMLASGIGVRPWCRGNVSACMMIVQQAVRWGMDPYAVANKAYFVNDQVAFESQLVNAVVNTSRMIVGRLRIRWEGEGERLVCYVSGRLVDDPDEPRELEQKFKDVTIRKSPLWAVNTKQQLAYHTTRAWARLYVPEVLLGIYTPDEIADGAQANMEARTAPGSGPAPDRRQFDEIDAEDAEVEEIQQETAGSEPQPAEKPAETPKTEEKPAEQAEKAPETINMGPELPANDAEWGMWERSLYACMTECQTAAALGELRVETKPLFDHASQVMKDRISGAFEDNFVELAGK